MIGYPAISAQSSQGLQTVSFPLVLRRASPEVKQLRDYAIAMRNHRADNSCLAARSRCPPHLLQGGQTSNVLESLGLDRIMEEWRHTAILQLSCPQRRLFRSTWSWPIDLSPTMPRLSVVYRRDCQNHKKGREQTPSRRGGRYQTGTRTRGTRYPIC